MTDPRLDPTRGGTLKAEPNPVLTVRSGTAIRKTPSEQAEQVSQLRYGDVFNVYETTGKYAWGQCLRDGYVGYVEYSTLAEQEFAPTHRINTNTSFLFDAPNIKAQVMDVLTFASRVQVVEGGNEGFAQISSGGFMHRAHLTANADWRMGDVVANASRFVNVPYLWGGITPLGLDCSGLLQISMEAANLKCPRDSDMQAASVGKKIADSIDIPLKRGDIIFMAGHVGLMFDTTNLLHANAFHGKVVIEPLADVAKRYNGSFQVRRLA